MKRIRTGDMPRLPANRAYVAGLLSLILVIALSGLGQVVLAAPLAAATDPGLASAANASILSSTLLTNVGSSSTNRDVDTYPIVQVQPAGLLVGGTFHSADGVAKQAKADAKAADLNMLGQPLTSNQGPALDGLSLVSGVYDIGAGRLNGGVLTLNGPGVYIFRASSDFISSGSINFINGSRACDLYWHVQTLATINGTSFAGTIIAGTGVHFGQGVTLNGRALAIGGDVTLINDTITGPGCAEVAPTATPPGGPTATPGGPGGPTPTQEEHKPPHRAHPPKPVVGLPNTGGAPIRDEAFPWGLVIVGGIGTVGLGLRAYWRTHPRKQ